jgi:hypothetical protein
MPPGLVGRPPSAAVPCHGRFRDEVEPVKTLSHPNIVRLLDHSALDAAPGDDARQYLVMPHAKGGDLSKAVDRYRGKLDDVLTVAIRIAGALQVGSEGLAVDRPFEKPGSVNPVVTQGSQEGRGLGCRPIGLRIAPPTRLHAAPLWQLPGHSCRAD